jgi:ferric-dicitrate binding protein FerR (iron transport regulator)
MTSLDTLVNRYLDDRAELAPDELDKLVAGLRAEPARAVALREQLMVDDLLAQKLTVDRRNFLAQVEQRLADFERSEAEIDDQVAELRELATQEYATSQRASASRGWARSPWMQAALAMSLVAATIAYFFVPDWLPERRLPVAQVVTIDGPVVVHENEAQSNLAAATKLYTGQRIETPAGSWLTLEYDDKTQMRLSGGSILALAAERRSGAKRVRLDRGELWADVARQSAGAMEISTPHAGATVLGTQFRLTVTADDTLLEVTEGLVRLSRLDRTDAVEVAASQSGVGTDEGVNRRDVEWPSNKDGLVYAFDPFVRRIPRARQGTSDWWYSSRLEAVGSASVNALDGVRDLSGGMFRSREDGEDIVKVIRGGAEFTLELVFLPSEDPSVNGAAALRPVISLAGDDGKPNFALVQADRTWSFALRTSNPQAPQPLAIPIAKSGRRTEPLYLAVTYRDGELAGYIDGRLVQVERNLHGDLSAWSPATLLIGADSRGNSWRGTIHALAIYGRTLDSTELARNVQNYRKLAAGR